jgi:hypothetical protein
MRMAKMIWQNERRNENLAIRDLKNIEKEKNRKE